MKTLQAALLLRSAERAKGIDFVQTNQTRFVSFHELFLQATKTLATLQDAGVEPGNEVVFQIEKNQSFVTVFGACILGGMILVSVSMASLEEYKYKLFRIWTQLNRPFLITDASHVEALRSFAKHQETWRSTWGI